MRQILLDNKHVDVDKQSQVYAAMTISPILILLYTLCPVSNFLECVVTEVVLFSVVAFKTRFTR